MKSSWSMRAQQMTLALSSQFTDAVFTEKDWQGYGIQRQRAQAYAKSDWVLMLDADERITSALRQSIIQAVQENDQNCVYAVARLSYCFGRFIRHSGWYPDTVARLYPRLKAAYNASMVHEKLVYPSSLKQYTLKGDLHHYTYRDLHHYLVKSAGYAQAWSAQRHAQGRRATLRQGVLHAIACFIKMYLLRAGFLDGRQGLLLALLSSHSTFAKYAALWERAQKPSEAGEDS